MANRIEIPLIRGMKMVVEQGGIPEYPMEVYIGIEDSKGCWVQDLAVVVKNYHYKQDGQIDYTDDAFRVFVYGDSETDDCTDEFLIKIREDCYDENR